LAGAVTTTLRRGDFEQAEIPIENLLEAIGQALATIHYAAKVDGNDVEFLLGGTPEGRESIISAGDELSENGGDGAELEGTDWKMSIWIIDFDRAKTIALSTEVEEQFARVLDASDTTVPKARKIDPGYRAFKKGYVERAKELGGEYVVIAERVLGICETKRAA
jgi:hypothetical protein